MKAAAIFIWERVKTKMKWMEKYKYHMLALLLGLSIFACLMKSISNNQQKELKKDGKSKVTEEKRQSQENGTSKEVEDPTIRVVLKTDGFANVAHPEAGFQAAGGLKIQSGDEVRESAPGEVVTIRPDDAMFAKGTIHIEPKEEGDLISVVTLNRGCGVPNYRGKIELFQTAEGVVLVNELSMEQYLYGVVPSEMPASYEPEALKVQAVCARSYAYKQMQGLGYPEYQAHIDDSTAFQVYGNSGEQESTNRAVDETRGQKIWYQDQVITAYYFSTSCGKTTTAEAWGNASPDKAYLQSAEIKDEECDYEAKLPWYRWRAVIPSNVLTNLINLNTQTNIGNVTSLEVTKYGPGGVAQQIVAVGDQGSVTVDTENKIRTALGGSGYTIEKQDGTVIDSMTLLPSAFFTVEYQDGNYVLNGGGFGHGIGMSQNGANEMAKKGKNYLEILTTFYHDVEVR